MRPDMETIKLINEYSLEFLILEDMGIELIRNQNGEMIHWFIKDKLQKISKTHSNNLQVGNLLIERLKNCQAGKKEWATYENICTDIFEYLFKDNFRKYTYENQSCTHDKKLRRDLIINNNFSDSTCFWAKVEKKFDCNLIIVDFKNYTDPLEQNDFYLPSKYLNLNIGRFAIICSRKGLGDSAKALQQQMFNKNELIICLDDNDLIGMIKEKMNEQDPTYRLDNLMYAMYKN
ncbi:hypothetical protein EZS27_033207 [termite gut metagenome]|uniref:Restriction endonuclease type IV Mrr domain-containing protein n=1 Tax=termite gut metagenome TaxID=433724 RepID=A0A5J4Q6I0_9ZZZZ